MNSATGMIIQDQVQQMEHWVQCYSEIYFRGNIVTKEALNNIECLPVLEELDSEPTLAGIKEALDSLTTGKAPGKDNLPVEVL